VKSFPPFKIDLAARTLWRDDVRVPLTHKAFDILRVLVERAGHVVTRDAILSAVWPDTHVHPDNVKVLIGEIRRALGDNPARPQFIRSIVKRGYLFIAPVIEAAADSGAAANAPIFVGRQAEMDRMLRAADEAARGHRQVVFVNGDAGIGKTALCEAFLRVVSARHGVRAGWTQCVNTPGPTDPYAPLVDVLNRLARSTDDESVPAMLMRHAPSWLPMLPALADRRPSASPVTDASRLLRELVTALEAVAEQTFLLIWIEDIHWADPATIDVINSLAQRTDSARLLLVATARPSDSVATAAPVRRLQAELVSRGRAELIALEPFTVAETHQYLAARFDDGLATQLADILHRATGGNALFLVASADTLVRHDLLARSSGEWTLRIASAAVAEAVPASFASAVARELDELSADERAAIAAASVIGATFSLWLASQVARVGEVALEPVLEMLARRRRFIVRVGVVELPNGLFSPSYRFKHALYQEVVIESLTAPARSEAHARAGLAIERLVAGHERDAACELAGHFHAAGDHARAVRYFRLAADAALKRSAPREAAALLHGAAAHAAHLDGDERHDVDLDTLLALGQAQLAAGDHERASETLARLEQRAADRSRPNERLRALIALDDAQSGLSYESSMALARRITDAAEHATDGSLAASAAVRAGMTEVLYEGWSDDVADRCFGIWRALPRTSVDESRSLAIRLLFFQIARSAYAVAWTAGRKLLPMATRSGGLHDALLCCYLLGLAALHLGRWGDATEIAAEGAAMGDRTGNVSTAASMRLVQAWIALERQRWEEARRLSVAERPSIDGAGCTNAMQMSLLFGGAAALGLGDFDAADADFSRLRSWYERDRLVIDWFWKPQLHSYLAELALGRGDLDRAAAAAAAAQDAANLTPERTWRGRAHVIAAQVALARKAFVDAERYLRQARRETRGIEAPLAAWRIEAVTATLLENTAQPDSARRARIRYERTLDRLERSMGAAERGATGDRTVH
jgi:DNA-binding winged helix-turn-helix (wHTH) protein